MKHLLRSYLINLGALYATSQIIPSLQIVGGLKGILIAALAFMLANFLLVPLLRLLLLPLNLLTVGIFAWLGNVLALYFLVTAVPSFKVLPYQFAGISSGGFVIPAMELNVFQVVIIASFLIGLIIHFLNWLIK